LKSHEKTHSGAREHVCGTCGKALSSRNALKVHERALHTLDRPFKCEVPECGMTYMTRLDLDRHAAKHAKNKAREEKGEAFSTGEESVKSGEAGEAAP
jgi:KRAB domain-containing zinc finger protein